MSKLSNAVSQAKIWQKLADVALRKVWKKFFKNLYFWAFSKN